MTVYQGMFFCMACVNTKHQWNLQGFLLVYCAPHLKSVRHPNITTAMYFLLMEKEIFWEICHWKILLLCKFHGLYCTINKYILYILCIFYAFLWLASMSQSYRNSPVHCYCHLYNPLLTKMPFLWHMTVYVL